MPRIFVPQPIPPRARERLESLGDVTVHEHLDREIGRAELLDVVRDQEILFAVGSVVYDREVIDAAPDLRMIAAMQTSPRLVDLERATARSIPVSLISNSVASTTAEFTFMLLLGTAWRLPEAERFLRDGRWRQRQSMAFLGTRVMGKTLGIVGAGEIGRGLAWRARGCGMHVTYTKRHRLEPEVEAELQLEYRDIDDLFRESDIVALTPALTPETRGLVGERLLGLMKPDAILINTSRGAVLDEQALEDCLRRGGIRGAGLDVFEHEPGSGRIGPRPGLLELPNVVCTPHIGSAAIETREEMAGAVVDSIEAFLAGARPPDLANPEVYDDAGAEV